MYDFKYEHFNSIYDFEKVINNREVSQYFRNHESSKSICKKDWYATDNYEQAEDLLKNGWNAKVENMNEELRKFKNTIDIQHKKQIKSIAGYAPCVPNAIRGVPKSMLSTKTITRKENKRSIHIIINNTASSKTTAAELMESGMTVLKLAYILDKMGVRTKIDVIPKMSISNKSCYGCTVSIKDYRQPFNLSKMAYPLAHTSFFRRHGFRFFETMEGFSNSDMAKTYGSSLINHKDEKIVDEYFKFAGFMKNDVVYIDLLDTRKADFDYKKLAEIKGIELE